jgi:hypothetical protein
MAFEIVNYILGEDSNPLEHAILVNLTTLTLAPFSSATQYTIAAEFHDVKTARQLQLEVEAISVWASNPH